MKSESNAYRRLILRKIVELMVTKINLISIKKLELIKLDQNQYLIKRTNSRV